MKAKFRKGDYIYNDIRLYYITKVDFYYDLLVLKSEIKSDVGYEVCCPTSIIDTVGFWTLNKQEVEQIKGELL
jgi:hypothetical protein